MNFVKKQKKSFDGLKYAIYDTLVFFCCCSIFFIHILVRKIFSLVTKQQTPAIRIYFVAKAWLEKSSVKV